MKLTNISLAILVAIGLVACGGSDDKNNPVPDPEPKPKPIPGNDNPPPPPKGDSALDPKRAAPDLTVADDVKSIVAANKRVFVNRGFANPALGYSTKNGEGYKYIKKTGTDPANVKLTSTYNYSEAGDLIPGAVSGYADESAGAIFIAPYDDLTGANKYKLNAFVETKDGYVRVAVDTSAGKVDAPSKYTPDTKFHPLTDANTPDLTIEYDQSEVIFIANAYHDDAHQGFKDTDKYFDLGKLQNASGVDQYDPTKTQVVLNTIKVFGTEYSASTIGQNLDFGQLKPMREIQTEKVTGSYNVMNLKGNADSNDDKVITREVTLGNIKAYNLPYSIALVTTNVDEKNPATKNIFNLDSEFQVRGFQTVSLPQDGRALYKGKSFSANTTGDVTLYADFFSDRAGLEGVIENRKDNKGTTLADLSLKRISLVDPSQAYKTGAEDGDVTGDTAYADNWTVQLYGQEAQEAAGMIRKKGAGNTFTIKEVYNTQRGALTNKSNDSTVTP